MGNKVAILQEEYEDLKRAKAVLEALEAAGVDNWEWYGEAMSQLEDQSEVEVDNVVEQTDLFPEETT